MREENSDKLRDDFYSITFISYVYIDDPDEILELSSDMKTREIGESEVARNLMNCLFIFIMQITLVCISFFSLTYYTDEPV